ncbi:hypothetical protein TUM4438_10290 [Shewanella sairae]|uniref:Uncharacterized protein n=1 Tax=Shewanella sairae TaxID=190310 RepID=A0ABQ4P5T1_9GAMM|nr:hypothetical protein [Shewanella sairae]MCL1130463.1 hypothetical protein [Shewanella sairae]GIU42827.1 hypothetical protein TUM4438_10290 [Shewanella sairae]
MDKQKWIKWAKKSVILLLSVFLTLLAIVLLCMGAAAIPENALTPLPYAWYMVGFRVCGYIGFYYYYRSNRYMALLVAAFASCYEGYLFMLYQTAQDGLLW